MKLKYIFWSFILLLTTHAVNAQYQISGTIKDIDNGKIINGVHVFVPELQKGTITDVNGEFILKNLPESNIIIQFSHIGYKTISKNYYPGEDTLKGIKIFMEPTVIHSDAVVVSAGSYSTQHENAIKIETIKSKDFEKMNASVLTAKIAEVPGVDMISKGNAVVKPVIRGLSNSNILVLNNGVKLENFQFSENHPFLLDEFGVDRVEVIKGPASLLYGSDAIGGIVNVIGEKPASIRSLEAEVGQQYHSNSNGYHSNIGIKQTFDDFFWGVRGGIKTHQDYESGNEEMIPNSRFNNKGLHAFTGINKSFGSFRLYYDYTQMHLGMTVPGVDTLISAGERRNNFWYQSLDNHLVSLKNKLFIRDWKMEANFSFQQNGRKLITKEKTAVDMLMSTYSSNLNLENSISQFTNLIFGFQGSLKKNKNFDAPNRVLPDHEVNEAAVFGLLQHNFSSELKTQGGVRFDYRHIYVPEQEKSGHDHSGTGDHEDHLESFKRDYQNISFSLGSTYRISQEFLLRSNIASAYRTPNVAELTQEGVHGARYESGNKELKSQRNYEGDLSFHYHCCHMMFDVAGFYNSINNYIYLAYTSQLSDEDLPVYRYEQTNAELFGGEISFEAKPVDWFNFFTNFSLNRGNRKDGTNLPFIPHDKLKSGIALDFTTEGVLKNTSLNLSTTYAFKQKNPSLFETKTQDYFLIDIRASSELELLKQTIVLNATVQNLFDVNYIDHLSTLKPLGYHNMGRNLVFSLKIPITYKF